MNLKDSFKSLSVLLNLSYEEKENKIIREIIETRNTLILFTLNKELSTWV